MKSLLFLPLIAMSMSLAAQVDSTISSFTITGYAEAYYLYDAGQPDNHTRPGFIYSMNRHNEFNLNLGFVKGAYQMDKVRGNLALMAGTYANANLAAEPATLRNIFEANAGVRLSATRNLWLDAGIFGSHIGFESAVGKDCWTVTRSILADNSPYYESGAKITYISDDGRWTVSGLLLNGWQRIQRVDGNQTLGFGHQLVFKPSDKVTLNSSSFFGNDKPDAVRQTRIFHNFFGIFQISENWGFITGFDIGMEKNLNPDADHSSWFSPVIIARYSPSPEWNLAIRGEYYADEKGVMIATGTPNGFKTTGFSLNVDRILSPNALWRVEVKGYSSRDEIFTDRDGLTDTNFSLTTALAISL